MEAQGRIDNKKSCPRCFALNDGIAPFCHECGASIDGTSEGSDSEVYQDLAKANLLRLRGEAKAATDVCLGILRRYPNNATAHSLLAEIHYQQDDLKQAAEWYEMALDLAPDSVREREMLEKIREKLASAQKKEAVETLQIKPKPVFAWYAAATVVTVLAVGAAAFAIGSAAGKMSGGKTAVKVNDPITVPAKQLPLTKDPVNTQPELPKAGVTGPIAEDTDLLALLKAQGTKGTIVNSVLFDPSIMHATVTAAGESGVRADVTAMYVIGDVFVAKPDLTGATVRITQAGKLVYVASASRSQYDEAQALAQNQPIEEVAAQLFPSGWVAPGAVANTGGSPVTEPTGDQAGG